MFDFIGIIIKGGPVMAPLLLCSIVSLAITIERLFFWKGMRSKDSLEEMLRLVERRDFAAALKVGQLSKVPGARVLVAGLRHRNPSVTKALDVAAQAEIPLLKSRVTVLDTIVTLTPLLGLLGTVIGMIGSFDIMSVAGIGQPHAVTGGVAEALIATATGLLIAILTLIPYNYFSNRAEREVEQMEYYGSRLELLLAAQDEKN
ncbi:MAG: MotA/TolQ/ExbB proton channel family protein [Candidatus Binatia bacterium]